MGLATAQAFAQAGGSYVVGQALTVDARMTVA
jgi:hypothetical protein